MTGKPWNIGSSQLVFDFLPNIEFLSVFPPNWAFFLSRFQNSFSKSFHHRSHEKVATPPEMEGSPLPFLPGAPATYSGHALAKSPLASRGKTSACVGQKKCEEALGFPRAWACNTRSHNEYDEERACGCACGCCSSLNSKVDAALAQPACTP